MHGCSDPNKHNLVVTEGTPTHISSQLGVASCVPVARCQSQSRLILRARVCAATQASDRLLYDWQASASQSSHSLDDCLRTVKF
eukprot:scaffold31948_cov69-Cyclotella_meneghiniana.AAC.6